MKRTTYIIIGVVFTVIFAHMIAVYIILSEYVEPEKLTFDERGQREFADVKVIYLDMEREGGMYNFSGKINVSPVAKEGSCTFDYPEILADHIHFKNDGDTLYITMDINDYFDDTDGVRNGLFSMDELIFDLRLDSVVTYLNSHSSNARWNISHISFDSLQIRTDQRLEMIACTVNRLSFTGHGLKVRQTTIKEMYLELAQRKTFEMQGGEIEKLFCTGNGKSTLKSSGAIRELVWTPKEEDASLTLELQAKSEMVLSN